MNNKKRSDLKKEFLEKIQEKEKRKIHARETRKESIWYGLGMFGVIGWSVMIPTLISLMIGIWLDKKLKDEISWSLTFLIIGIVLGCFNAWNLVAEERKEIEEQRKGE